jgi:hypothetical protein
MRIICGLVVILGCTGSIMAAENVLGVDITADFLGKYVWRGQNLNDDPVFQPSFGINYGGLTASIWGNLDMTSYTGNSGEFTEYDYSLDYTTACPGLEGIELNFGVINYDCVSLEDTTEVYYGAVFDLPLSPAVTIYHDVDEVKGAYAEFSLTHTIEKIAELSSEMPIGMETCVSLGWGSETFNKGYWDLPVDDSSISDLAVCVSFPVEVKNWTVAPNVHYITILDSDMRRADTYDSASDYFFMGISLSTGF